MTEERGQPFGDKEDNHLVIEKRGQPQVGQPFGDQGDRITTWI